MFGENQEASEDQGNNGQTAQQQPAFHAIFDRQDTQQASSEQAPVGSQNNNPNQQNAEQDKEKGLFSDSLFKTTTAPAQESGVESAEDLIAKLSAQGYKVEKAEVVDENQVVTQQLQFIESNIAKAKEFIALTDDQIVKEKVRSDKAELYNATGRAHLIGTQEFGIEVDAEIEANFDNPVTKQLFANNVRQTVKANVIDKNSADQQKILSEQKIKSEALVLEKTKKLESAFDRIHKEGYMGIKFDEAAIKSAYSNILNGNFTKEMKDSPEELAELALVHYHKKALKEKTSGPTYGEGVRDAALSFKDKGGNGGSPMGSAMQRAENSSSGTGFDVNKWLSKAPTEEEQRAIM